jgi:hypothetical protein
MMDWIAEVEDVGCPVDDMNLKDYCSRSSVQREWYEGK